MGCLNDCSHELTQTVPNGVTIFSDPSPEMARSEACVRDLLLDNLKERVQEVAVLAADGAWAGAAAAGGAPGGGVPLTEDEIAVTQLCAAVEQCLLHGMRRREFGGVLPFWACLERLESAAGPAERGLRNTVAAVALAATLRTPVGRARAIDRSIHPNDFQTVVWMDSSHLRGME